MAVTYDVIQTQTLSSDQGSIAFASIPSSYTDLVILGSMKFASAGNDVGIRFNTDSGSNYFNQQSVSEGTSLPANQETTATGIRTLNNMSSTFDNAFEINIANYSSSSIPKSLYSRWFTGTNVGNTSWGVFGGGWTSTAAINRVDLYKYDGAGSIAAGSTFTLIGIAKA